MMMELFYGNIGMIKYYIDMNFTILLYQLLYSVVLSFSLTNFFENIFPWLFQNDILFMVFAR
jgi:hypothetical protein